MTDVRLEGEGRALNWLRFCCVSPPTARGRKSAKCCDLDQLRASGIGQVLLFAEGSYGKGPIPARHPTAAYRATTKLERMGADRNVSHVGMAEQFLDVRMS